MPQSKKMPEVWKKIPFAIGGILFVLMAMLLLYFVNTKKSQQSFPASFPTISFQGQYKIGDGDWIPVKKGQHIPATRGDVTLKGQFHMASPEDGAYLGVAEAGIPVAFYLNHIQLTIEEEGQEPYYMDIEHPGAGEGMCGELCIVYELLTNQPVTLIFHNPHAFGNDRAIDLFLEELSMYGGLSYEKEFMNKGSLERNTGIACVVAALVLLGTALFSALLRTEGSGKLWLIGMALKLKKKMSAGKKGEKKSGGFDVDLKGGNGADMMQMLGGFSVLRLTGMMGMMNVSFTKEELLKMNKKLNRIKKPVKKG